MSYVHQENLQNILHVCYKLFQVYAKQGYDVPDYQKMEEKFLHDTSAIFNTKLY